VQVIQKILVPTDNVCDDFGFSSRASYLERRHEMNQLSLNSISFPVRNGTLSCHQDNSGRQCWSIQIQCDESAQLDYRNWPLERHEDELDWLAGTEPCLYAQMLPIPVSSPEELPGRTFPFPQSPDDEPAEWDRGAGWLFFCLYLFEHELAYPMTVTFVERQQDRYRVNIVGTFSCNSVNHELRADAWLDWVEGEAS